MRPLLLYILKEERKEISAKAQRSLSLIEENKNILDGKAYKPNLNRDII